MPSKMPAGSAGEYRQNSAANSVPMRLAASTIAHSRAMREMLLKLRSASTGSTTVMVLSVNNCWRAMTIIRNPTL